MKSAKRCIASILTLVIFLTCSGMPSAMAASSTLSISSPSAWSVWSYDDSITVRWNSVSGAVGYYIAVRNVTTDELVLSNTYLTTTSKKISSYIDEIGQYRIWVGAVDSSSKIATESFTSDTINIYVSHEPDITNGSASSITQNSAVLSMTINRDYEYSIDDWGFYVGTSSTRSSMEQYSYGYTTKGTKTATITGLSPNTTYYYRAFAENEAGEEYTTAKSFTTLPGNLPRPVITYPISGNTYTAGSSIKLQWNAVSGVDGYRYYIKQLAGVPDYQSDSEASIDSWNGSVSSSRLYYTLSASNVKGGYWYKFVVEAYAGSTSSWSEWCYVYVSLDQPVITYPINENTYTPGQSIKLQWDAVNGASGYRYYIKQLSGDPDYQSESEPSIDSWNGSTNADTRYFTLDASKVKGGYWYKFVVEAYTNVANSWSEWCYIKIDKGHLSDPVVVSPINTATYTGYQSIKFDWDAVSGAEGYTYFIKQLDGFPDRTNDNESGLLIENDSTSSSVTEFTLPASKAIPGKWYKFVVKAFAYGMDDAWSEWVYCYIDEVPLDCPIISSPTAWSEKTAGSSITVKWGAVSGASGYQLYYKQLSGYPDTSNDNEPAIYSDSPDCGTALKYTVSASKVVGGYWYKFVVKAYATSGSVSWSPWVYVYVPEAGDLDRPIITSPVAAQNYESGKSIRFTWAKVDNATSYTYYIKQLVGEPDNSDNERAVQTWTGTTRSTGRSFTLSGDNVQPNTWYKFVVKAEADGYNSSWSKYTYIKIPDREDWIYYILPSAMTSVSEEAFESNKLLRTFDASDSRLMVIESKAFANCTNLKSINLPSSVYEIADDAFNNCPSLTIHCISGSYAESYAISKGIPVEVHGIAVESDVLQLSQTEWNIPTTDAAYTVIRVNSSAAWSASSSTSWLTLDKSTGSDGTNVVVNVAKNSSSSSRSASVTFTSGNAKAVLNVIQNASATQECSLTISQDYWEPSSDVLEREIIVRNNAGFTVNSDSSWLTYTINNATVTAKVTSASLTSAKTGKLTITCSDCGASKTVTVSTKGNVVPVPTGLKVTTVDPEALNVSWTAVSGASYYVERSNDGQTGWTKVKTVGAGTISFMDSGLSAGTTYYYRVYAQKTVSGSTVTSAASTVSSGRTGTQTSLRFTGTYGSLSDGGRDTLAHLSTASWQTTSDATTYKVSLRNKDTNTLVSGWDKKDVGNVSSVSLAGSLSEGTAYRIWVGAYNAYGHLIGQTNALEFTVQSTVAQPTIKVNSVSPTSVNNSGNTYFGINFTAKNTTSITFSFDGLEVYEKWDKESNGAKQGKRSTWEFDGAEIGTAYSYSSTTWSACFYPVSGTTPSSYTVTITAIGDGGRANIATAITVSEPQKQSGTVVQHPPVVTSHGWQRLYPTITHINFGQTTSKNTYKAIIDQFDVEWGKDDSTVQGWYEKFNATYCNYFVADVSIAMGAFLPISATCTTCGKPKNSSSISSIKYDGTSTTTVSNHYLWDGIKSHNLICECSGSTGNYSGGTGSWTNWFANGHATQFGWVEISETEAIQKANAGYLTIGLNSGHTFIVYPNGSTSKMYISEAGSNIGNNFEKWSSYTNYKYYYNQGVTEQIAHSHQYSSYCDDNLVVHQYCVICEPRTAEQLETDLFNMHRYLAQQNASEKAVSLDDPATLLIRSIAEQNDQALMKVAAYAFKLATFQWSDVVKKIIPGSTEVDNIRRKSIQKAVSGVLSTRSVSVNTSKNDDVGKMLLTVGLICSDSNAINYVQWEADFWDNLGDVAEQFKFPKTTALTDDALIQYIKYQNTYLSQNMTTANMKKAFSLLDENGKIGSGTIVSIVGLLIKNGVDMAEYLSWSSEQRQLFSAYVQDAADIIDFLTAVKNAYPEDTVIKSYCNDAIAELKSQIAWGNIRNVVGITAGNVGSAAVDFAAGCGAFYLFGKVVGGTVTVVGSLGGLAAELIAGTNTTVDNYENVKVLYDSIEQHVRNYRSIMNKSTISDDVKRVYKINILCLKISGLELSGTLNKGKIKPQTDSIKSSYESAVSSLLN